MMQQAVAKVSEIKHLKSIVDQFESTGLLISIDEHSELTLEKVIKVCFPDGRCNIRFARRVINFVAAALKKMHGQNIMHRNLHQGTVMMRTSNSESAGYVVKRLAGLEYAICMPQKLQMVDYQIETGKKSAPEVEAGRPYNLSADVW